MTACKDSLNGKKAVSATLAGVLAVGMVPAAAFAADQPADEAEGQGIELESTTSAVTAFNDGKITFTGADDSLALKDETKANAYKANAKGDGTTEISLGTVNVTPKGETAAVAATGDNYTVTVTKDGEKVSKIVDPGTYTVTVSAVDGDYEGGEVSATIEVAGAALTGAAICEIDEENPTVGTDTDFMYTGEDINYGVVLGGKVLKEGTDYTVKVVKQGDDAINGPAVEVKNAGTYYAVITGQGAYEGSTATPTFQVKPFNLAKAKITLDDVIGKTAAMPTAPTTVAVADTAKTESTPAKKDGAVLANPAELKLALYNNTDSSKGAVLAQTWDKAGVYKFTVATATEDDPNFTGSYTDAQANPANTVTCKKVDAAATFQYNDADWADTFSTVKSDKKPIYFDTAKVSALDTEGEAVPAANLTTKVYAKDGVTELAASDYNTAGSGTTIDKPGTYVVKATVATDDNTLGGSATCTVTVKAASVVTDATVIVKDKNGKIVDSVEKEYDGQGIKADDFTVSILDAKGQTVTTTAATTKKIVDADGEEVTAAAGAVDAGEYQLVIENDDVDFQGDAIVPITIKQVSLENVEANGLTPKKFDNTNNVFKYLPWNKDGVALSTLDLKYETTTKGTDGEYTWASLPSAAKVTVKNADGEEVEKFTDEGVYTVEIAAANESAEKNYAFPAEALTVIVAKTENVKFADVASTDWFVSSVAKVSADDKKIMNGYAGTNLFGPYDNITRGQVAVVLYNMATSTGVSTDETIGTDKDAVSYKSFSDVESGAYYGKAVAWAKAAGVVNGYGDGTFKPEQDVTRQEFAKMLANYAQKFGTYQAGDASSLADYADGSSVDSWATDSVAWAVEQGYMGKDTDTLAPANSIIRAEAAAMVARYIG